MKIRLNGIERETPAATLAELVRDLGLPDERIAIELNRRPVRRADWPGTPLAEGDRIEILHFVGGG